MASLSTSMFTAYFLNRPKSSPSRGNGGVGSGAAEEDDDDACPISFQISLPALLEALQIFGVSDAPGGRPLKTDPDSYRGPLRNNNINNSHHNGGVGGVGGGGGAAAAAGGGYAYGRATEAFSNQTLGMPGTCSLLYGEEGAPFGILLDEASVSTMCNLATYVPEALEAIPFDRKDILFKIIMQPRWLLDALVELAPSSPQLLTITVTHRKPYLRLSSTGPLGSSSVDFSRGRSLFEAISVEERWSQSFKFDMIRSATEAMRIADKVSIRGDRQGVLSLQFKVESDSSAGSSGGTTGFAAGGLGVGGGGGGAGGVMGMGAEVTGGGNSNMNWLNFTFVPFITDEEEDEEEEEEEAATETGTRGSENGVRGSRQGIRG